METEQTIRHFWFGAKTDDKEVADERAAVWWAKNPAVDREIARRFEACVTQAAHHALDAWAETPTGCLALILLTDQFPRHIYRDSAQAFAFDPLARAWCKDGIRAAMHERLRPIERVFFYLPLEHSESVADQEQSVTLYQALVDAAAPEDKPTFDGFLRFALRHREIILRFGRFPHRNRILGRASSAEELAFLQQKGSSF